MPVKISTNPSDIATPPELPSPSNKTLPLPFGNIDILLFDVDTMLFVCTSKLPPNWGDVSSTTFDKPAPEAADTELNDKLPEPSVIKTWFESPSFDGKVKVTLAPPKLVDSKGT